MLGRSSFPPVSIPCAAKFMQYKLTIDKWFTTLHDKNKLLTQLLVPFLIPDSTDVSQPADGSVPVVALDEVG